jgi:hypothetical protein
MLSEYIGGGRRARLQYDEGSQPLPEPLVVDADSEHVGHRGVRSQGFFHLNRVDIFPPDTTISSSRPTTNSRPSSAR